MEKVYADVNGWIVQELTDFYTFKSVDLETGEEKQEILSWSRGVNLTDYSEQIERVYDIEWEGKKYYFLLQQKNEKWQFTPENNWEFDELCKLKNIKLTGDIKDV
jgi:hypothetical protein